MDLHPTKGLLLHGSPGTGKTSLAKAIANETQSNFISIKGPELLDKFVGESERGIRKVFPKDCENVPTVVFFDEINAIATERGRSKDDANVGERVVLQLLTELDGLEALEDVIVIAATTNRISSMTGWISPAVLTLVSTSPFLTKMLTARSSPSIRGTSRSLTMSNSP